MTKFYKIPAHDMCMGDPAPFNQRWEVRVPVPIADVGEIGRALHSRFSDFKPGDLVNICSFDSLQFRHLVELAAYRVVSCDYDRLTVLQIGEIVQVPKPDPKAAAEKALELGIVERNGAFEVRDENGAVLEVFVERAQAELFIRRVLAPTESEKRVAREKIKAKAA